MSQPVPASISGNTKEQKKSQQFVDEIKIEGETVFTISPEMLMQQQNLPKQRKTRWGEFKIRKQEVQEDVVFNPIEALVSGNSLMAITQYGQSELELKRAIFGDPSTLRKSKWHHDIQKTFTPPMMDYISPDIALDEVEYLIRLYRLDEIACKVNDFQQEDQDVRSPSPQPIYDRNGMRVNTRDTRRKDALARQKVQLVEDCMKMKKQFVPPSDYKPIKKVKRIYLTQSAINDTNSNYLGKIIGNKGSTQKRIQQITGCSISLRGRGISNANKDPYDSYQKPHVLITADTNQQIDLGVEEIQKILNGEADEDAPIGDGIVGIVEGMFDKGYCENCNETGHRTWQCPEASHIKYTVKCTICGQTSHPTSDCPQKAQYLKAQQQQQINKLYESQYSKFKDTISGDKQKQASFSFITDFNKKQLLKIEGPQSTPSTIPPVALGGFALPSAPPGISLPNFDKPASGLPNFSMPKFQTKNKDKDTKNEK